ncbi:hypothetical protein HAX54_000468, partial [Datura stramonium]|nr:hypothetical protein [Datura stramonium]
VRNEQTPRFELCTHKRSAEVTTGLLTRLGLSLHRSRRGGSNSTATAGDSSSMYCIGMVLSPTHMLIRMLPSDTSHSTMMLARIHYSSQETAMEDLVVNSPIRYGRTPIITTVKVWGSKPLPSTCESPALRES